MLSNLGSQFLLLLCVRPIYALLHDAAPVLVARNLHALPHHGFVYELVMLRLPREEDLLDHVVTVDVFCQLLDLVLEETGE